ncbi:SCO7613 C-terminal domain-containing membrane protein [Streptomyces sp. NPDC059166]|uniref:SCO7613 C-terminal domain-containing membrane protein n=1 Tax=Streptomyces sp. NPDC059166 TaxID=3346752 RepID=UPI0036C6751F
MTHVPPPAEELALLDQELARLDARRIQLLNRRSWLLSVLHAPAAPQPFAAPAHPVLPAFRPPARPAGPAHGTQNVLLVLGGLLLAVAAIAFTLFSWGEMGIAGRSAVLATVTACAMAAPAVLLARALPSTAEAVAVLALLLTVLDAIALHEVAAPGTDGVVFSAVASTVLAVVWVVYGLLLGRLRTPLPAAVVAAQLPLLFTAWAADASATGFGWALLVTAAADVLVARWGRGAGVRVTACVAAWLTGLVSMGLGLGLSVSAGGAPAALAAAALLLAGAGVALFGAWGAPGGLAVPGGFVAGAAAVAAAGGVPSAELPWHWAVVAYLVCGAALAAVLRLPVPRPVAWGVSAASVTVVAAAVIWAAPVPAMALLGPVSSVADVWSGAPRGFQDALGASVLWPASFASPVVLALSAILAAALHVRWPHPLAWRSGRAAAGAAASVLGWCACLALLVVADVPFPVAVGGELLLVAALLALTARRGADALAVTWLVCAMAGAVSAGLLGLAAEPATHVVLAALVVLFGAGAARSRVPVVRSVLACACVLSAVAAACATGASLGWSAPHTAAPVLLVTAATVLFGARSRVPVVAVPVECAGAFAALVAVCLSVTDAPFLALVLGMCGVLAAAAALRPERRRVAGGAAAGLFVAAAWVRLAASGVTDPEPYTLPVSLAAFAVGHLRRRREPAVSSWVAYGPALSTTLVPSLFVAWGDPHWLRPLLLGVSALVITLAGARLRLQAPLVLGGSVLALDGLHELAPHVVQVFDALPRWAPPALVGLLLLAVGATYEQRLRDARRVRESFGRMR